MLVSLCLVISQKQYGTLNGKKNNICNPQMEEKRTFPIVFNINICNKHPSTYLTGGQYEHYNAMLCLTFGIPWFKWKGHLSVSVYPRFSEDGL